MHLLGIRSIVSKKFPHRKSTLTNEEKSLIVNLIKDLDIVRINHVWTTDVTYIPTINEGTFYLISYILTIFLKRLLLGVCMKIKKQIS